MREAFTIVELMVVITIIVVLLALLTPGMEQAIYQAELAVCGTTLRTHGTGVLTYAFDYKRAYPYRVAIRDRDPLVWQPTQLYINSFEIKVDERPTLRPYTSIDTTLCALSGGIDADRPPGFNDAWVYGNYNRWYGWRYAGQPGMFKVGDKLTYLGPYDAAHMESGLKQFSVLVTDRDAYGPQEHNSAQSSHPDANGVLRSWRFQDAQAPPQWNPYGPASGVVYGGRITLSIWMTFDQSAKGELDLNYAYDDGSVRRLNNVRSLSDPREDRITDVAPWEDNRAPNFPLYLPKEQR